MIMGKDLYDPPYLDDEERDLIESIEAAIEDGRIKKPSDAERAKLAVEWQASAKAFLERKPVTLRIQSGDINRLKSIAARKGMPYQTLVASVLHQYANGDLIERPLNLKPAAE
jgi:predicted DNA binding CopG/RHH family protein